jgi:uncharacterized repeat protein (TIGR03803 family)
MRISTANIISTCLSAALLAACGANNGVSPSTPMSVAPQIPASLAASGDASRRVGKNGVIETVLYSFGGPPDGLLPIGNLHNVNGTLYGTTEYGGAPSGYAYGTVYKITTSGKETVLYRFGGGSGDGQTPYAGVIKVASKLYGTTEAGGAKGWGTIFSVSSSGKETVLHNFNVNPSAGDGATPYGDLIDVNGTLYGTASNGGEHSRGTVFTITPSGAYNQLYSFDWNSSNGDGFEPYAGLTNVNGTLYGTTIYGGYYHTGNVYSITPSGAEATIYSFGAPSHTGDGLTPYGGLTNVSGVLYGTTEYGGAGGYCPSSGGCGTVFRVTTSGAETLLHSFGSTPEDGQNPYLESLINVNGKLYGTTSSGGAHGHGTIFRITKSGAETVLYSFGGGSGDGAYPFSGLVKVNGTLYGTTYRGGAHGFGTFFSLSGF